MTIKNKQFYKYFTLFALFIQAYNFQETESKKDARPIFQNGKLIQFSEFKEIDQIGSSAQRLIYLNKKNSKYEGLSLKLSIDKKQEINESKSTEVQFHNEIIFQISIDNNTQTSVEDLIDETHVNGSIQRVQLLRSILKKLNLNKSAELDLRVNWFHINEDQMVFLASISNSNLKSTEECKDFISSLHNSLSKSNGFKLKPLKLLVDKVTLVDECSVLEDFSSLKDNFLKDDKRFLFVQFDKDAIIEGRIKIDDENEEDDDLDIIIGPTSKRDFIISVVIPASIIVFMFTMSFILACILHNINKRQSANTKSSSTSKSPIYKQKPYLTKGVPVILYEEMAEKPMEEEDYSDGHRMPLILRNEKPPMPAPPEYHKSANHLSDEQQTLNDLQSLISVAPLAVAEADDLNDQQPYQPPQPVVGIKDTSRRTNPNNYNQNIQITSQLLP